MRWMIYIGFAVLYLLTTLYGLGPVLLADGSFRERMLTLAVVLLIYAGITWGLRDLLRRTGKR
ncbi:DUF6954 family protein [Paenibacillus sp. MMS20-IR301]|uniref:DUF6954 family protein n=1 Tax=Paenibacillus sp. MMS20-IR301 TaxID=2895946 RepID=UPI0028E3A104|nr:hypothetical protein [Paenibacillus sp. MMS20-IR301]WNS46216.1 hypothetical protein LOS79_13405 [Paenibacillus sp. MMS20-IR301]